MQQIDDIPPNFANLYRTHGLGLLAIAAWADVPVDVIYTLLDNSTSIPSEVAQKVLDTVNDLTGKRYTLKDVDFPLTESIDELHREINAFFFAKGTEDKNNG